MDANLRALFKSPLPDACGMFILQRPQNSCLSSAGKPSGSTMTSLIFDTCVLVCHLRGEDERCTRYIEQAAHGDLEGFVSSVTVAELYAGERLSAESESTVDSLLDAFTVLAVDRAAAAQAGRLVRRFRRSHGLGMLDAVIAATALLEESPVLTMNTRHFAPVPGLVVVNPLAD